MRAESYYERVPVWGWAMGMPPQGAKTSLGSVVWSRAVRRRGHVRALLVRPPRTPQHERPRQCPAAHTIVICRAVDEGTNPDSFTVQLFRDSMAANQIRWVRCLPPRVRAVCGSRGGVPASLLQPPLPPARAGSGCGQWAAAAGHQLDRRPDVFLHAAAACSTCPAAGGTWAAAGGRGCMPRCFMPV